MLLHCDNKTYILTKTILISILKLTGVSNKTSKAKVKSAPKKATKHQAKASSPSKSDGGGVSVKPAEEKILQAIGKLRVIGTEQPTRDQVQKFSGNTKTKAGFDKNLGNLKKKGFVEYPDGKTVALTDQGVEYVGEVDPSDLSNEAIQNEMKEMIPAKARDIFDALLDGKEHDRKKLAEQLKYDMNKLSGYQKNISQMRTLGFVDYPSKTTIKLTDSCFPLGRPGDN